jgi:hypothetical protein
MRWCGGALDFFFFGDASLSESSSLFRFAGDFAFVASFLAVGFFFFGAAAFLAAFLGGTMSSFFSSSASEMLAAFRLDRREEEEEDSDMLLNGEKSRHW